MRNCLLFLLILVVRFPGPSDGAHLPVFSPDVITAILPEGNTDVLLTDLNCTTPGGSPCSITITDGDDSPQNKFTLAGTELRTSFNPTDFESLAPENFVYTLTLEGTDPSDPALTGAATVFVYVDPVNEHDPSFDGLPYTASVSEDIAPGSDVMLLTGMDDDLGPDGVLSFSIVGGNVGNVFDINPATGRIFTTNLLDYQAQPSYNLLVRLLDGTRSVIANVAITVIPVKDNTPQCTPAVYHISMDDSLAKAGTTIQTLTCSDVDGDPLTYSIESGDTLGEFNIIVPQTVVLVKDLNANQQALSYLLTIKVSDGSRSTDAWLRIDIIKHNAHKPVFLTNPMVDVRESDLVGTEIASYTANDPDAEPYGIVSYRIDSVTHGGEINFLIDEKSGRIMLARQLDYESFTSYELNIVSTDGGGLQGTGTLTVNVQNDNDNPPVCTTYLEAYNIPENIGLDELVSDDIQCSDLDGDALVITMVQNPSGSTFSLSGARTVLINELLDFETQSIYDLQISVSDGGNTPVVIIFTIDVTNVNEYTPLFTNSGKYYSTISEASQPGVLVTTVTATDGDKVTVSYSFVAPQPKFNIGSGSGTIMLSQTLDAETQSSYNLLIRASDGQRESTATVFVTVDDVNEPPTFDQVMYSFTNTENTKAGTIVGKITARDPDVTGNNALFRYSIISGNVNSHFLINPDDGTISVAVSTDYEFTKTILVVTEVSDFGSTALSEKCTVNISIIDVNDNAPEFPTSTLVKFLSENSSFGDVVTQVFAKDVDSDLNGNNVFEFRTLSNVPFSVHSVSGTVTVNGQLDREIQESYEMIIEAVDRGFPAQTGLVTLTITLTDVNDNDPIILGSYDKTIPENAPIHSLIFSLSVNDSDIGDNGRFLYSILSGDPNFHFKIDQISGFVQVATNLDRESQSVYELVIQASDLGSPQRSTSVTATVTLSDVNDVTPKFNQDVYTFSINENSPTGTVIGNVGATDGDLGSNALVTYRWKTYDEGHAGKFMINETSGEIAVSDTIDREAEGFYSIRIIVQDSGSLFSEATVNITITDENDNAPIFTRNLYSTEVYENFTVGSLILPSTAYDLDIGSNAVIIYDLDMVSQSGVIASQYFSINDTTGDLFLIKELDREIYENISMTITATDGGSPPQSTNTTATVFIVDVNDNRPIFTPSFYNAEASYEHACGHVIAVVTALDTDQEKNAEVLYEMDPAYGENKFLVDSTSGQISTNVNVNDSQHVIFVRAHDLGTPNLMSSSNAKIRIDSFNASETIISFSLAMKMSTYLRKEADFLALVKATIEEFYATAYVRRWCVEDKTSSVVVRVYAVKNDLTDWETNLFMEKPFMTNGEFLDSLNLNANNVPTINGTDKPWRDMVVTDVKPFGEDLVYPGGASRSSSGGDPSDTAIALAVIFPLLALALLAILVCILWRRNKRKKENANKSKTKLIKVQSNGKKSDGDSNSLEGRSFVVDEDKSQMTRVGNPSMVYSESGKKLGSLGSRSTRGNGSPGSGSAADTDHMTRIDVDGMREGIVTPTEVGITQGVINGNTGSMTRDGGPAKGINNRRYADGQYPDKRPMSASDGKSSARTFDNRGIDKVTGWVYETNPENNGRQWLRTPDGDPIFKQPFV